MKILITGATGFVGSHLNERLRSEGHETFLLVRNEKKAKEFNLEGNFISGSLSADKELQWLSNLPEDLDSVVHVAGIVHSPKDEDFVNINTLGTKNLFKQLHDKYNKLHFVFISSLAAGGPSQNSPRMISDIDAPISAYGKSKLDAEHEIEKMNEKFSLSIIRPPMIIGPRDPAIVDIFKMVKSQVIIGPGMNFLEKSYSYIFISDLIDIITKITTGGIEGKFYSSHSQSITFSDIIETIKSEMKIKRLINIPIPHGLLTAVATASSWLPISSRFTKDKAKELIQNSWCCSNEEVLSIGLEPKITLKEAIQITKKDYEQRNWL